MPGLEIEQRILVVGVPRSGTTLVQSLLAAHSGVASFTESHFFSRHFKALPRLSAAVLTRDPRARLHDFLIENPVDQSGLAGELEKQVGRVVPPAALRALGTRQVARGLLRVLDELARTRDRPTWVEKTPGHLPYAGFLERISQPESVSFVHVIRDGLETVASLHAASRSWERSYDLDECVERWNTDIGLSASRAGRRTDHFVCYEELTSRPEPTLERLLAGLGLGWEPKILERYAETSKRLITPQEPWKANVGRSLRTSGTSELVLTAEQRDRVSKSLRRELYERLLESSLP